MVRKVDAHGLSRHFIVADRLEGAAVGGVHQQHDARDKRAGKQHVRACTGEIGIALEQVRAVGDGTERVPLEEGAQDLGEAERCNGEIIALETQHRKTDQIRKQRRDQTADEQRREHAHGRADRLAQKAGEKLRNGELDKTAVKVLIHAGALGDGNAQHRIGICTEEHKACLTEGKQTGKAVQKVHRYGNQRIHARLLDDLDRNVIAGEHRVKHECRGKKRQQDHRRDDMLFLDRFFLHRPAPP